MQTAIKFGKWFATVVAVLVLTLYFGRAFDARTMPPLGTEHRIEFDQEFTASRESDTDWSGYLAIEGKLAAELADKIPDESRSGSPADRYVRASPMHTDNQPGNWNRSYELSVPSPRGVAVLLHGLSDSPYSMLATAQTLAAAGYNVVVPRMPGHGFAVGGLSQARWEDWNAAVRIAVRRATERQGGDGPLLLVGYSNGGLLAVDYALSCDSFDTLPCPQALVLMSPAIEITPAAAVMNWHAAVSWLPYFEKFKWRTVLPEVDPFKFTSFPKRAAWEIHKVSNRVHDTLANSEAVAKLPPILTFQSVVDDTVHAQALVTALYDRLPANGSELVIYDINRNNTMSYLMKNAPGAPADYFASRAPLRFSTTVVTNRDRSSNDIAIVAIAAGESQASIDNSPLGWPSNVFSLSHIAIPFRPDDGLYGDSAILGGVAPRGERGVLLLNPDYFLRVRYNPFYEFQSRRLVLWLEKL